MAHITEINTIINALFAVSEKFSNYESEKEKALEDYRSNALEQRLNAIALDLKAATKNYVTSMDRAAARMIDEAKAVKLASIFLSTPFDGDRHEKRVNMITAIENGDFKL